MREIVQLTRLNEVIWLALRKVDSWNEKATRSLSVPFESPPLGFPVEPSLRGFELGVSWKSGGLLSYVRMYVLGDEYTDSYRMTLPPVTCVLSSKYAVRYHIFSEDPIES